MINDGGVVNVWIASLHAMMTSRVAAARTKHNVVARNTLQTKQHEFSQRTPSLYRQHFRRSGRRFVIDYIRHIILIIRYRIRYWDSPIYGSETPRQEFFKIHLKNYNSKVRRFARIFR